MPKKNRKNPQRRNKRKVRNIKRPRSSLGKNLGGFLLKNEYKVRLRVSEYFNDNPGAPGMTYVFIANGLYNPFGTFGTAQPAGFSYYMQAYLKYRVLSSRIRIRFVNQSSLGAWVVLYPTLETTLLSLVDAEAQKYSRMKVCGSNDSTPVVNLSQACSSRSIFGHNVMDDEDFSGDFGTNPAFKWYWILSFFTADSNMPVTAVIDIDFDIIFYGRKMQVESTSLQIDPEVYLNKFVPPHKRPSNVKSNLEIPVIVDKVEEKSGDFNTFQDW